MKLEIGNKKALATWMRNRHDRDLIAIKGLAPLGATYDDGTPITQPVNVAWKDSATGEVFHIQYVENSDE